MNYFVKIFTLSQEAKKHILLFGYVFPTDQETRYWGKGEIGEKMYRHSCVMNDCDYAKFVQSLIRDTSIELADNIVFYPQLIPRPQTIYYPKNEGNNSFSLIETLSYVQEYWTLDKSRLIQDILCIYDKGNGKEQRNSMGILLDTLSVETGICFNEEASGKLGNVELYHPSEYQKIFYYEIQEDNKFDNKSSVSILKKSEIDDDVWVHCVLCNSACILDEVKELSKENKKLTFTTKEPISYIKVEIWKKSDGSIIYMNEAHFMRDLTLLGHLKGQKYLIKDKWTEGLLKCFKRDSDRIQQIQNREDTSAIIKSKISDSIKDPWREAENTGRKLIRPYCKTKAKGAFCRKTAGKEGEIDSFLAIQKILQDSCVNEVILIDPFFSIMSMGKLLPHLQETEMRFEIITSLTDTSPDEVVTSNMNQDKKECEDYIEKARQFLKDNENFLYAPLRIWNVTHNGKPAFHDRYLVRYLNDGSIDGFLLSNSLNSAGQFYHFVIAPMDVEVTYEVLEYIAGLKDIDLQKKKPKLEQLDIELLWDTYEKKSPKAGSDSDNENRKKIDLWTSHSNSQDILKAIYHDDWNTTEENALGALRNTGLFLFYSNQISKIEIINFWEQQKIDKEYMLMMMEEMAKVLEQEEEVENKDINSESFLYRKLLKIDLKSKNNFRIQMMEHFITRIPPFVYYQEKEFLKTLYDLVYELNPINLIEIIEQTSSPSALCVLLNNLRFQAIPIKVYRRLLYSPIIWFKELAYYLFTEQVKEASCEQEFEELFVSYLLNENKHACYQLMYSIQLINIKKRKEHHHIVVYNQMIKKLCALLEKEINYDLKYVLSIMDLEHLGAERGYIFLEIVENLHNNQNAKELFLNETVEILKRKWKKESNYFSVSDFQITENAAKAVFFLKERDNNILKSIDALNQRYLFVCTEPYIRDRNFSLWNKAVLMVLWRILFLKYYLKLTNNSEKDIVELCRNWCVQVYDQLEQWHDYNGLKEKIFPNSTKP